MRTILVTGGAGFIGSSLSEELLRLGNKVIILDNFNDYYDPSIKEKNINDVRNSIKKLNIPLDNLLVIKGDIRDTIKLNEIFDEHIDIVVHLAAMAGVRPSIEDPQLYYDVNINGTLNLLECCRKTGIKKFIFASSSSVYGNNKKVPFSEKDIVDYPISPYASTKKSGELLCHTYHHLYNISVACLRFFTVYGPRQRPDLAIHKFTKLILEGKEIPFFGDGSTSRDYTYIDDIVDGIVKTIAFIDSNPEIYEVFNLGGDKTITLKRMVETIEIFSRKKALLKMMPMQPGDVDKTCADISHSNELLGYKPNTKFEDGIKKFIDWIGESDK